MAQPTRCGWAGPEPIYLDYHDHEWGRPTHDDRALFELLSLEGMQAGLSWITILKSARLSARPSRTSSLLRSPASMKQRSRS